MNSAQNLDSGYLGSFKSFQSQFENYIFITLNIFSQNYKNCEYKMGEKDSWMAIW